MNLRQALIFFITETDENLRCKQDTPARIYSRKLRKMSKKKLIDDGNENGGILGTYTQYIMVD